MAMVYVIQETRYDFTGAEEFGAVVFLSNAGKDDFNNVHPSEHNDRMVSHIKQKLRDYDPEHDWIVITGSPYICATVFSLLGLMGVWRLRMLRWDNRDFRYLPLIVDLPRSLNF
jgi:hypothetical protein